MRRSVCDLCVRASNHEEKTSNTASIALFLAFLIIRIVQHLVSFLIVKSFHKN